MAIEISKMPCLKHTIMFCWFAKGMNKYVEMDEHVRFAQLLENDAGPVIIINMFYVKPEDGNSLIEVRGADAAFFKKHVMLVHPILDIIF